MLHSNGRACMNFSLLVLCAQSRTNKITRLPSKRQRNFIITNEISAIFFYFRIILPSAFFPLAMRTQVVKFRLALSRGSRDKAAQFIPVWRNYWVNRTSSFLCVYAGENKLRKLYGKLPTNASHLFFNFTELLTKNIMEKLFSLVLKILLCILQQCCCRRARLQPSSWAFEWCGETAECKPKREKITNCLMS